MKFELEITEKKAIAHGGGSVGYWISLSEKAGFPCWFKLTEAEWNAVKVGEWRVVTIEASAAET